MTLTELKAAVEPTLSPTLKPELNTLFASEVTFWSFMTVMAAALEADPYDTWMKFNSLLGVTEEHLSEQDDIIG